MMASRLKRLDSTFCVFVCMVMEREVEVVHTDGQEFMYISYGESEAVDVESII